MTTQLTLLTVPADPTPDPVDEPAVDEHRRSLDRLGWLDRRTIVTGRRGLANARAALAEANRRVTAAETERENSRDAALAREASDLAEHHRSRGHAA